LKNFPIVYNLPIGEKWPNLVALGVLPFSVKAFEWKLIGAF
jgi:hypothetical protein